MTSVDLDFPERATRSGALAADWARTTLTRLREEDRAEGLPNMLSGALAARALRGRLGRADLAGRVRRTGPFGYWKPLRSLRNSPPPAPR